MTMTAANNKKTEKKPNYKKLGLIKHFHTGRPQRANNRKVDSSNFNIE